MDLSWLTDLLPILNATGIPLLAIGIILLIRSYQKSANTYKDTNNHLREENERLRSTLAERDTGYFDAVDRVKGVVSKAVEVMGELQAQKQVLLAQAEEPFKEAVLSDVANIKKALTYLYILVREYREHDDTVRQHNEDIRQSMSEIEHNFDRMSLLLSDLADQIADTKSRVTITRLSIRTEDYETLKSETAGHKRGLVAPSKAKHVEELLTLAGLDRLVLRSETVTDEPILDAPEDIDEDIPRAQQLQAPSDS